MIKWGEKPPHRFVVGKWRGISDRTISKGKGCIASFMVSEGHGHLHQSFHHQHYWHFRQIILCCSGGCPVPYRMFSSVPRLYLLGSSNTHPKSRQPKMSPNIAKWFLGDKIALRWESLIYIDSNLYPINVFWKEEGMFNVFNLDLFLEWLSFKENGLLGWIKVLYVIVASWVYTTVKTHLIVHFK